MFQFGGLGALLGGAKLTKVPRGDGTDFSYCKSTNTCCMDLISGILFRCQY